jgi:hypothetical protein
MQHRLLIPITCIVLTWVACSESTSPTPSVSGTWQVTVQSLDSGALAPSTFSVVITPSKDTYVVTMPTLTWNRARDTYDTFPHILRYGNDTAPASTFGVEEYCSGLLCSAGFIGRMNRTRDTVAVGNILFFDTVTVNNTLNLQIIAGGTFTAHK